MLKYRDLINIKVMESNEEMNSVAKVVPEMILQPPEEMVPYSGRDILLRKTVILMLKQVLDNLRKIDSQFNIILAYGYRHPDIQTKWFRELQEVVRNRNPYLNGIALLEATHQLIAVPTVAGHPTGGAVDLTIAYNGKSIDMGTEIAEFSKYTRIETFSDEITWTQKTHRMLLRTLMLKVGFAPFNGEWWHFSYGDREWARYYNKPYALYSSLLPG